jgi:hypothetical protein
LSVGIGAAAPSGGWDRVGFSQEARAARAVRGRVPRLVDGARLLAIGGRPVTLGHWGRWLERNAAAVDQVTAEAVSGFLAEYRADRGRLPGASVWPLLEYLRAEGAVPPEPPAVVAPAEQLVSEYREWPVCERGLAPVTVRASEQFARRFLAGRACAGGSGWDHGRQGPRVPGARVRAGEQRLGRVLHLS